jgi:hypothetical protein
MSSSYGGGGGARPRPLYGVWINEALQSNDPDQMRQALEAARDQHIQPLYGVIVDKAISGGASREELQQLLQQAESVANSDLQGAISRLKQHLGTA